MRARAEPEQLHSKYSQHVSPRLSLHLDPAFTVTRRSRVLALDSLKVHLSGQFSVA